jgi:hypothetical protein
VPVAAFEIRELVTMLDTLAVAVVAARLVPNNEVIDPGLTIACVEKLAALTIPPGSMVGVGDSGGGGGGPVVSVTFTCCGPLAALEADIVIVP